MENRGQRGSDDLGWSGHSFHWWTLTAPESAAIWTVMQSKAQLYSHLMRECSCSAGVAVVTTSANLDTLKTSNPIPSTKDIVSGVTS